MNGVHFTILRLVEHFHTLRNPTYSTSSTYFYYYYVLLHTTTLLLLLIFFIYIFFFLVFQYLCRYGRVWSRDQSRDHGHVTRGTCS
jgi:hypothetical protein